MKKLTTNVTRIRQIPPKLIQEKTMHIYLKLQILLQTLESMIFHHEESTSVSYDAKSQAIFHPQHVFLSNVSNLYTFFL